MTDFTSVDLSTVIVMYGTGNFMGGKLVPVDNTRLDLALPTPTFTEGVVYEVRIVFEGGSFASTTGSLARMQVYCLDSPGEDATDGALVETYPGPQDATQRFIFTMGEFPYLELYGPVESTISSIEWGVWAADPVIPVEDPREIPGLLLWLSAEAAADDDNSNGIPMERWIDQSGNGNNCLAVGTNRPVWRTTDGSWVDFMGTSVGDDDAGYFNVPLDVWDGLTEAHIVYVLRVDNKTQESGFSRMTQSPDDANAFYSYSDGNVYDHFATTTRYGASPPVLDIEQWHIYETGSKVDDWTARFNGSAAVLSDENVVSFPTEQSKSTLGSTLGITERLAFLGGMKFVAIFDHALTDGERASLYDWLSDNPDGGFGEGDGGTPGGGVGGFYETGELDLASAVLVEEATLYVDGQITSDDPATNVHFGYELVVDPLVDYIFEADFDLTLVDDSVFFQVYAITSTGTLQAAYDLPEPTVQIGSTVVNDPPSSNPYTVSVAVGPSSTEPEAWDLAMSQGMIRLWFVGGVGLADSTFTKVVALRVTVVEVEVVVVGALRRVSSNFVSRR